MSAEGVDQPSTGDRESVTPDPGGPSGEGAPPPDPAATEPGTAGPSPAEESAARDDPSAARTFDLAEHRARSEDPEDLPEDPSKREIERLREIIEGEPAALILPAEVFIQFYPAGPEQVINALRAAGFDEVYFESLGDELVALAYLRRWRENTEKKTWIRSTSPLVVEYCRARHPELLPFLAPIVPPALALARYLRHTGEERALVYAGLDDPEVNGERHFAAVVSFAELAAFLEERDVDPRKQPLLLQTMPPERRRFLSAAGGLPLAMLDEERASSRHFRKLRGLHYLGAISRLVSEDELDLGFVDILPFDGALDHPALGPADQLYWRRGLMELAEPEPADMPVIDLPDGLDLSIEHRPRRSRLPHDAIAEIEEALEQARQESNGHEWTLGASEYAEYLTLTETLVRSRPDLAMSLLDMSRNYFRAIRDATHDALTDLYSYRALVERAREELGQANRSGGRLALLFVDLDRFKEINDLHGHPTGNALLRGVGRALELSIRSTDIAGRFGGDEFVLLLIDADFDGAIRVAEEVRQRIADLRIPVEEGTVGTTASIGVAFHTGSEGSLLSIDDLFAEADAALYIAKAHGGNRVHPAVREGTPR
ncbi:MAG: diguanylate cyclase [Gemmatimonadota bacterium]|nr:diguanylate cyclase [Gemmatimonadota bacterium]